MSVFRIQIPRIPVLPEMETPAVVVEEAGLKPPIGRGDLVRLRSGGPTETVVSVAAGTAETVRWCDKTGQYVRTEWPTAALVPAA